MKARLQAGALCLIGSVTCREQDGDLRIANLRIGIFDDEIVIDRSDIDDLAAALMAYGGHDGYHMPSWQVRVDRGSISVIRYVVLGGGKFAIATSKTPDKRATFYENQYNDLMVALDGILGQRETLPATPSP